MPQLGKAKHRIGQRLGSGATAGEGTQNMLCAYLAAGVLDRPRAQRRASASGGPIPPSRSPSPRSRSKKATKPGKAKAAAPPRPSSTKATLAATTTAATKPNLHGPTRRRSDGKGAFRKSARCREGRAALAMLVASAERVSRDRSIASQHH